MFNHNSVKICETAALIYPLEMPILHMLFYIPASHVEICVTEKICVTEDLTIMVIPHTKKLNAGFRLHF